MKWPGQYEYIVIFEDDWTRQNKLNWFFRSDKIMPTSPLCNLERGDLVEIETRGETRDHQVTCISESHCKKQFYIWVRPII